MENEPMWVDKQAARPLRQLLTADDREALRGRNGIRLVTKKGRVYEGILDLGLRGSLGRYSPMLINGKLFSTSIHTLYLLDPDETVVRDPAPVELTDEEVRDVIADLCVSTSGPKVSAPSITDIVDSVLGFDPALGMSTSEFGGKSRDGYTNQFLKMGPLRRSLARLQADGAIRKLTSGSFLNASADDRYAKIRSKTGYVTSQAYDEAVAAVDEGRRKKQIEQLRTQAGKNVAEHHQDEVEQELVRLAEEAGIRL